MTISNFDIYASGICAMSVCVNEEATPKEIEKRANFVSPTGISSRWKISEDKFFRSGQTMPCVCESRPDHKHWLLVC